LGLGFECGVAEENTASITVSLWVGSADPQTVTFSASAVTLATNPVLPYRRIECRDGTSSQDLQGVITSDFSFAYARPAGVATLFAGGQTAIDVATGKHVSAPISNGLSGFL
jgi:hypothetical protein